jgi:hypothetical protein
MGKTQYKPFSGTAWEQCGLCELAVIDVSSRFPQNVEINMMQQGLINKKATSMKVTKLTKLRTTSSFTVTACNAWCRTR